MKILIIDDHGTIVETTTIYLKTKGFSDINVLTDSRKVLDYIVVNKPDVVLIDLNMPHISAKCLIRDIRLLQEKIKIYIIPEDINPETISLYMTMGANEYFTKPVDNKKLVDILKKIIN